MKTKNVLSFIKKYAVIFLGLLLASACVVLHGSGILDSLSGNGNDENVPVSANDANGEASDEAETEEVPERTIVIPEYDVLHFSRKTNICDFSYENSKDNDYNIIISIIRTSDGKRLYTSNAISPGNKIENIELFSDFDEPGTYDVMIKVDAYAVEEMKFLNSFVLYKKLIAE